MGQQVRQLAVVGKQQQAFRVEIQAADTEEPPFLRDHLDGQRAAGRVLVGTEHPDGLVERVVHLRGLLVQSLPGLSRSGDLLAVQGDDLCLRIGLGAQMADDGAFHRDAAFQDKGLTRAAGTESRLRQDLLQSDEFAHAGRLCAKGRGSQTTRTRIREQPVEKPQLLHVGAPSPSGVSDRRPFSPPASSCPFRTPCFEFHSKPANTTSRIVPTTRVSSSHGHFPGGCRPCCREGRLT